MAFTMSRPENKIRGRIEISRRSARARGTGRLVLVRRAFLQGSGQKGSKAA